jgi:SpoVK/Ycf46/Vps4 family AAA+-type ATPase
MFIAVSTRAYMSIYVYVSNKKIHMQFSYVKCYSLRILIVDVVDFFATFDHSSYLKNNSNI